jgi:sigma-B regulation protein RsbU (phosphoserine phosphatase)
VIETRLAPGDRLVFYSDGIVEAADAQEAVFGYEQTAETIRKGCVEDLSAAALIDRLIGAVKDFAGGEPQGDDMTVVVLRVE